MIDLYLLKQTTLDLAASDANPVKLNAKDTRYFDVKIGTESCEPSITTH